MEFTLGTLSLPEYRPDVEFVERKGEGHPDTICDALAERFSAELSRFYLDRFGTILHHNVDKALLRGGASRAVFGGGEVLEPIEIYLAGRATTHVGGVVVPAAEIAEQAAREWLREHLHALDPDRHVRIVSLVRPGSVDLSELFGREHGIPLSNDTSFGVGYAPLGDVERTVLELDRALNARDFVRSYPAHGEDLKIMAVRTGARLSLTVARAFVAVHVPSLDAYRNEKARVDAVARSCAGPLFPDLEVRVNAADAEDGSSVYLTVTGTSAEAGDDGEVGRGNRGNGLITPMRPMSLEALAGKNSVSHVGKLYNLVARAIAEDVVLRVPGVASAECYLVSRIGAPIDEPRAAHVRVGGLEAEAATLTPQIEPIVREHLSGITGLWRRIVEGAVSMY